MTRVLAVDDSRAIRTIVKKQLVELGFEVDEAEDGEQGLARLEECEFDLVVLDVTMPVLDGPAMLERMRAGGNQTPVLMLTSESKRSIVSTVMKLGIDDYILKPFKPEEFKPKVLKCLKMTAPSPAAAAAAASTPEADAAGPNRQFMDILVVDDMDNVHKRLRQMIPEHVTMNQVASAQAALTLCRERVYRVVFVDTDIPDVNSAVLASQLRTLQPHAAFISMPLRSVSSAKDDAKRNGFDGVLFKPFDPGGIEEILSQYFENQELVTVEQNVVRVKAFSGREDRLPRYFQRLGQLIAKSVEQIAAACYEDLILEASDLPARPDRIPRLVISVDEKCRSFGVKLRLVGTSDTRKILNNLTDTASVQCFDSAAAARSAAT